MATRVPRSSLHRLRELASLLVECPPSGPVSVGVTGLRHRESHAELAVRPLHGPDVVAALAGFRAPPVWEAFGIVAPGHARALDDDRPEWPVVVAVFTDRSGAAVDALDDHAGVTTSPGDGQGRLRDTCARVLGLPTAAPEHDLALWAVFDWIDRALTAVLAADLGASFSWPELCALDRTPALGIPTWAELRAACSREQVTVSGISAVGAAWMDDGMFSREAVSAFPPLLESLRDLRELLPPSVFEQFVAAIARRLSGG